jgi:hypothetical protein
MNRFKPRPQMMPQRPQQRPMQPQFQPGQMPSRDPYAQVGGGRGGDFNQFNQQRQGRFGPMQSQPMQMPDRNQGPMPFDQQQHGWMGANGMGQGLSQGMSEAQEYAGMDQRRNEMLGQMGGQSQGIAQNWKPMGPGPMPQGQAGIGSFMQNQIGQRPPPMNPGQQRKFEREARNQFKGHRGAPKGPPQGLMTPPPGLAKRGMGYA